MYRRIRHKGNINLLDLIRRLAISNKEEYLQMVRCLPSSKLRTMILGERDWITPWGHLIAGEANYKITESRLSTVFDDRAIEIINALDQELEQPPLEDGTAIAAIDDYIFRAIGEIGLKDAIDTLLQAYDIPSSLPMVKQMADFLHIEPDLFDRTVVVASQHILGSSVSLLRQFMRMGVEAENVYVLGKVYSTNRPAMLILERLGMNISPQSVTLPARIVSSPQTYEDDRTRAAAEILKEATRKTESFETPGTLLILDDGGTAIQIIMKERRDGSSHTIIAVEQTASGIHKLRNARMSPSFPVVNVADSQVKHHRESPLIAKSVLREFLVRLKRVRGESSLLGSNVLILGFGPIGVEVAKEMHRYGPQSVAVYDSNTSLIPSIKSAGFTPLYQLNSNIRQFDVIIGCTGERSLPDSLLNELGPETVLASASSSNIEFNGLISRRTGSFTWPWSRNLEEDSDFQRAHNDYSVDGPNGRLWLLNGGFPVNFTGGVDPIPSQLIQMTRALMLGAAVEAMRLANKPSFTGPINLGMEIQRFVDHNFDEYEQKFTDWLGHFKLELSR